MINEFSARLLTLRSLFLAMASVQLVTAASGTLVALYFAETGASQEVAALAPAAYSLGFLIGCFYIAGWITKVGHIRSFAAGAAICIGSTLTFALSEPVPVLLFVRFATGVATAGLFALGDAWISVSAEKASRGRLLAVYATVLGVMSVGSQLMIQVLPEDLNEAFIVVSLLYCVAIVVLTAARSDPPTVQSSANVRIRGLFKDSPTAWVGAFTVGMVATTLLNVTPYRAATFGISTKEIALLIGALYLGRILFMYPLGWASDRHDRRVIILINGVIASALLLYFSIAGSGDGSAYHAIFGTIWHSVFLGLMVILGGALLTMYSLLVAHAMDRTPPVYVAAASVTMLFVTTAGGIAGPLVASLVSAFIGDAALHWALFLMMAGFTVFVSVRFAKRDASSPAEKTSHVVTGTTSTEVAPDHKT